MLKVVPFSINFLALPRGWMTPLLFYSPDGLEIQSLAGRGGKREAGRPAFAMVGAIRGNLSPMKKDDVRSRSTVRR
jgi:hypothetical protein